MYYTSIKHLQPGMMLAKPIIGETGNILLNTQNVISPTTLKRIINMGYQGAYLDYPAFDDIIVDDIISNDLRQMAFAALQDFDIPRAVTLAKKIVKELKYKEVLKMDLLDIKNDKNYVYKHSISVCIFSVVIGIAYGMNEEQLENLAVAGLLHDIGKFEIKKKVLYSKNIYNKKDMDEMKKHPVLAYETLQEYGMVSSVSRNSVLFHHENLDGTGYYSISADKLGVFPRILRIADTYDSLTALKKYRDAQPPAQAIEYLMANVNTLFDKDIVQLFVQSFPMYPVGFAVKLSNGEIGVIASNEENAMRPKIRLFDGQLINLATNPDYRSTTITEFV